MGNRRRIVCDGNTAASSVAYRLSEVVAVYPITPSSNMGELSDEWMAKGKPNVWGTVPQVIEMQSEGGAAGAVHGALQAGALTTTFTASQGLLLMIPNMYKIAGELTSYAMHVSARTVATHALSIFGDHSDVMACRQTGFGLLASASVQEAQDLAAVAHLATLASRVPFLHFFDGFRTSHELAKIEELTDDDLRSLLDEGQIAAHRARALTPDRPLLRGTAQNPDAFFQAREACNPFYAACPGHVEAAMEKVGKITGRPYGLFDYVGPKDAERVIVVMGSGAETCDETAKYLAAKGEKVGVLKVRLYRPWSLAHFVAALPKTVKTIAVLDRTKEPGAPGDPLWLDVVAGLAEAKATGLTSFAAEPRVLAGRYGLSSKEFTPAMVAAVFAEMAKPAPKRQFTIGIVDDVTHTSLPWDDSFDIEPADRRKAVFFGLGSDGTVSANKNSIQIIGEDAGKEAQAYFVYDSKKAGAVTTSHLRFGDAPIHAAWLVSNADLVACHQFSLLDRYDMLSCAKPGGVFLLNSPYGPDEVWGELPFEVQEQIVTKKLRFFVVDAYGLARQIGLGVRINTIMQACFFHLSKILPVDEAIERIKKGIRKSYARRGEDVLNKNFAAVDVAAKDLKEVKVPTSVSMQRHMPPPVSKDAPDFVQRVSGVLLAGKGDLLPVSAFPPDGTWPTATAQWEKRNIALEIPVWDEKICIQCNKCAMVCPHAAIRAKLFEPEALKGAPATFKSVDFKATEWKGYKYTIQVAPEDCTGCTLCMMVCPAKDKSNPKHKSLDMAPQAPLREPERANYEFFLDLPEVDRSKLRIADVKSVQFLQPLFEYSGACAGCGETPYIKLLTQLFGDRTMIANATGCSSIYGGNLPTTPYTVNRDGRGPTWSNSLFEDNAEFGLGMRLGVDHHEITAKTLLKALEAEAGADLAGEILAADQGTEAGIAAQRARVAELVKRLKQSPKVEAKRLASLADYLVRKSVWIVGGDGWAYDIGYSGLDHVLAVGRDVNILVLDTEVYSNTGGQASKSTPLGASAKFATAGKAVSKKDLGLMAMAYGSVYVARVAFGAKDAQTVKAFQEAESYPGTSIIIAYSPCIAHGYDMAFQLDQQTKAVQSGYWPLYRFDPRRTAAGESPLVIDTGTLKGDIGAFMRNEARFRVAEERNPELYKGTIEQARREAAQKVVLYEQMAKKHVAEAATRPGN
ncbi:MAG TPA: pyruvate:ferredoxin (flavodoxin) oxidoreductase [Thermoanaerobaculia bacterium]|nr:pyruvate:ferredoxin (flavodoxin) oxidoreductase [Thermoanaerobaculia bacterium]